MTMKKTSTLLILLLATLSLVLPVSGADASVSMCRSGYYENSRGSCIPRPHAASSRPEGASAKCRDGSYSFSQSRSGTCSHHGGVSQWY